MLVNADVKSLEIYVAADLSDDKILKAELLERKDLHAINQARFKLPTRKIAKIFIFKLLYGATAYGYYTDSDFMEVGFSTKQWQGVIDEFYSKYNGIYRWHESIVESAKRDGFLEIPSGRYYNFKPTLRNGEFKWPITTIKNYPVQGFGAELVSLARSTAWRRLQVSQQRLGKSPGLLVGTIHDSLVVDTTEDLVYTIRDLLRESIEDVPKMCKEYFDYEFSLPLICEVTAGLNKFDMKEI